MEIASTVVRITPTCSILTEFRLTQTALLCPILASMLNTATTTATITTTTTTENTGAAAPSTSTDISTSVTRRNCAFQKHFAETGAWIGGNYHRDTSQNCQVHMLSHWQCDELIRKTTDSTRMGYCRVESNVTAPVLVDARAEGSALFMQGNTATLALSEDKGPLCPRSVTLALLGCVDLLPSDVAGTETAAVGFAHVSAPNRS